MPLPISGLELPIPVEYAPTILYLITSSAQILDTFIGWHHASNLLANGLSIGENDLFLLLWKDPGGEILEDLPLRTSLAHTWTGDGRREDNAPFGAGLGTPTRLLIPSLCREKHYGICWLNQHLRSNVNILMYAQRWFL